MANQTITTDVNYDDPAIAGLLNGETITINSGSLTIDADVRWNQQAAVMGNINPSTSLGGSIYIDGTQIWEVPFTASTGLVPTQAALGLNAVIGTTSGGAGELTRVWATGSLTPAVAGAAMPATGIIKLRYKFGVPFVAGEIINLPGGATVTAGGAGSTSWIHVVGGENLAINPVALGNFTIRGDYYVLGTTNGLNDQTFQYPVADHCPAILVETSPGSGFYEWWLNGADGVRWNTATKFIATDQRGKYFGCNATTGVITIALSGANACGYLPPAGCAVRIPNVICSNSNSTNWNANTLNGTAVATRYRIQSANNGAVDIYKQISNWQNNWGNPKYVDVQDSAFTLGNSLFNCTGNTNIYNVAVGLFPLGGLSGLNARPFVISSCVNGGTVDSCRMARHESSSTDADALNMSNCNGFTVSNCQLEMFGATGSVNRNATVIYPFQTSRCGTMTITNLTCIGGSCFLNTHVDKVTVTGFIYADRLIGITDATQPESGINIGTCTDAEITGPITFFQGISSVQPYNNLINVNASCKNVKITNIGSQSIPLDLQNLTLNIAAVGSTSSGTYISRSYVVNSRSGNSGAIQVNADVTDTTVDNCWSDYSDAVVLLGKNIKFRGIKSLNNTTPQSVTFGASFYDCFTAATTGRLVFCANKPTSFDSAYFTQSLGAGSGFNSAGTLIMINIGDSATWETPWVVLGHIGLANTTPTFTGTNSANFTLDFQYDTGSGWNGTWLAATGANLSGVGALSPTNGFRFKLRATVNTASTTNAINFIRVDTTTTATDQGTLYPLPFDGTGVISNLLSGSRIQIYNQTTSTELYNGVVSGTSYSYEYYLGTQASAGDTIRIRVAKLGKLPQTLLAIATSTGFSATSNAQDDAIYILNGVDGSLVTEFVADYPNIQVDISDPDQITTVQRVYAWLRYVETTQNGIAQWFDVVDPTDEVNYEIDVAKLDLKLDNTQATPVLISGGRLYRSDDMTVIATTSGSIHMDPNRVYLTDGISTTQDAYNNLADTFLRRSTANAEASTFGDPISLKSMYGMVAQGTHNTYVNDSTNKLVVTKSNETTVLGTRSITNSPNAQPITGLNSD